MSHGHRSIEGCPSAIHSATARPTPPAWVIQTASAAQNPRTCGASPRTGIASGVNRNMPLTFRPSRAPRSAGSSSPAAAIAVRNAFGDHSAIDGITGAASWERMSSGLDDHRLVVVGPDHEPLSLLAEVHGAILVPEDREPYP